MKSKTASLTDDEMVIALHAVREEMADCLLLILDASRRAGIKPMQLIEAAQEKMEINKSRSWPKPTSDEPVEHTKPESRP